MPAHGYVPATEQPDALPNGHALAHAAAKPMIPYPPLPPETDYAALALTALVDLVLLAVRYLLAR